LDLINVDILLDSSFGAFVSAEFFVGAHVLFFLRARLYTKHELCFAHNLFLDCLLSFVPSTPMKLKTSS